MSTFSQGGLAKSTSQPHQPYFSSFIKKTTQKPSIPVTHHSRGKSNSILAKASPTNHSSIKLSKSPPKVLPSTASRTPTEIPTEHTSHSRMQETPLKETKKLSTNEPQEKSRDISQHSDSFATTLDRHTFYSTNFSLFENRTNSTRQNLESPQSKVHPSPQLVSSKNFESNDKPGAVSSAVEQKKPLSKALNLARLSTGGAGGGKPGHVESIIQATSPMAKPKRPESTKQVKTTASKPISQTTKNFFNNKTLPKSKALASPSNKYREPATKSPMQPFVDIDYIEEIKAIKEPYNPNLIKSATFTNSALYRENNGGSPGTSLQKKRSLIDPETAEQGKINKIFKGLDNKSSQRFSPEKYKRLGKGAVIEDSNLALSTKADPAAQKAAYKAQRRVKGNFLSHGDMILIENSLNKTEKKEEHMKNVGHIQRLNMKEVGMKTTKTQEIPFLGSLVSPQNLENLGAQFVFENNLGTDSSIEQTSSSLNEFEAISRTRSIGENAPISRGGVESIGEIEIKHKSSLPGRHGGGDENPKQNEHFENFYNTALSYMTELIETKDSQGLTQSNIAVRDHEDYLTSLFDHIIKEIYYIKKEDSEPQDKIVLGKKILLLLDMGLKSVGSLVRKKNVGLRRIYQRSVSGKIVDRKATNVQDWKFTFEELYGLDGGQTGFYGEGEKLVREKLCKEIEKRRGEIDDLEKGLKDLKEIKSLQFVQGIKSKVSNLLKSKKKSLKG